MSQTNTNETLHEDIDRIKSDLSALRKDLKALSVDALDAGRTLTTDGAKVMQEKFHEEYDAAQALVRKHPLAAVGTAFVVGWIAQSLLRNLNGK